MTNKEQKNYENIFNELKLNIFKYSISGIDNPKEFHLDFEISIGNAFLKIFPNIIIKYCYWHYGRN